MQMVITHLGPRNRVLLPERNLQLNQWSVTIDRSNTSVEISLKRGTRFLGVRPETMGNNAQEPGKLIENGAKWSKFDPVSKMLLLHCYYGRNNSYARSASEFPLGLRLSRCWGVDI